MGYDIRPLATLASQARQFFTQAVSGAVVRLWANTFTIFGKVLALLDFEHEMRRKWLFDQQFASTAEEIWLRRHGFELGLVQDSGTAASGSITVPCAGMTAAVPSGTQFQRADGATYSTVAPAVPPFADTLSLVVQSDAVGADYEVDVGDTLSLVVARGVPFELGGTATVDAPGIAGGTDAEDIEAFRARVLYRKQNPPQGGSAPDYVKWVGEVLSTAKDVFVDSFINDARSVWVCFTVTDQPDGVPSDAQVAIVQAYVNDAIRRPVTARVFVTAPAPSPQNIILGNVTPLNSDVQAAIAAELAALFTDEVVPATPSTPFTLFEEQIESAVRRALGIKSFSLVAPRGDQTFTVGGSLPTLSSIQYQ